MRNINEIKNPFTPNFGKEPAVIAERKHIMGELNQAFRNVQDGATVNVIFTGASGTGKTVMLTHYGRKMTGEGWIVVNVSCTKGMLIDIYLQAWLQSRDLLKKYCWSAEEAMGLQWQIRMTDIISVLNAHGIGLLITVDELNPDQKDMAVFSDAYQMWVTEKRKVALIMAGLPDNISRIQKKEQFSLLHNCRQYALTGISDEEIGKAFEETLKISEKSIEPTALQKAVEAIEGYPYMLQLVGYSSFFYAECRDTITKDDIIKGIKLAEKWLKKRALKPLLDGISDMDIQFLAVMAQDKKNFTITEISKGLGKTNSYTHRYKNRLIKQGIIRISEEGCVAFALPGLRTYVKEYCRHRNGIEE